MTREEIMMLGFDELEERKSAIATETEDADAEALDALNAELEAIEERAKALNLEIEERQKAADAVANGAGKAIEKRTEETKMSNLEIRNSHEYIEAYAKYIKTGKDAECRALLTENVSGGVVPVPEMVENRVRQAWENDEIFGRVAKTFVRGNLKVGFELSATDAGIHTEGATSGAGFVAEEVLTLGIVTMVPANIKKWITVSDEVLALGAEDFLAYIYDELTYKVIQKAADEVIRVILAAPAASTATAVGVPSVNTAASVSTVVEAKALLGAGARDIVAIMNRATESAIKASALGAYFAMDPFDGATVLHTDSLDAFSTASANEAYMIVGDLSGVQANMPEGESINFKFDDLSLAEKDLVKIVARLYCAIAVVGPKTLVKVTKPSA